MQKLILLIEDETTVAISFVHYELFQKRLAEGFPYYIL